MSLLKQPPILDHLSRMYYELGKIHARSVGEKKSWPYTPESKDQLLLLAVQMSRYDPRLLSILVEYFYFYWQKHNPYLLRQLNKKTTTPQLLGVVLSFLRPDQGPEFNHYYDYVMQEHKPANHQLYFINLFTPASRGMIKASEESLEEFSQWGFLARERPIIYEHDRKPLGHWGPVARQNIIYNLIQKNKRITISDYLLALDQTITRQQALQDLKDSPHVHMKGKGRGSVWIAKKR